MVYFFPFPFLKFSVFQKLFFLIFLIITKATTWKDALRGSVFQNEAVVKRLQKLPAGHSFPIPLYKDVPVPRSKAMNRAFYCLGELESWSWNVKFQLGIPIEILRSALLLD